MKRTLILFALCLFVANVQAKTIKYSDDVYYSGKVNDAGQPFGKGRLTILCHSNRNYFGEEERYKVVIDGKFNGSDVTEGHVTFYFGETQTYSGDVSYEIAPGASQVICKMTNGCFIEYSDVYVVQSELPLTLTINPGPRAQLKFDGTVFDRPQEVSGGIYMTDEEKSLFGEPAMYLQKSEYYVEDALSFRRKTTVTVGVCENGIIYWKEENNPMIRIYHHGEDYFEYPQMYESGITEFGLRRTFPEGVLSKDYATSGFTFKDNQGVENYVEYNGNLVRAFDVYRKVFSASSMAAAGFTVVGGELGKLLLSASKGDADALYQLSLAYRNGYGVTPNETKAEDYLKRAANAGQKDAVAFVNARAQAESEAAAKREAEERQQAEANNKKMLAEYKKTLVGKWKVTRLFNDAYNRCESGLGMTLQIKADGTYYATMTYTPPVTKQGVKLTFGVKGKWSVVNGGDVLLNWEERIINPQFTYSGNDRWTRSDIQRIQNSDEGLKYMSASGVAENKLVGGLWIFSGDGGNLISDINISGGQIHCNYWTGANSWLGRAYDCIMKRIQ